MKDILLEVLDIASSGGSHYADVRYLKKRYQFIRTENLRMSSLADNETEGVGIRVLYKGRWGFAGTYKLDRESLKEAAYEALKIAKETYSKLGPGDVVLSQIKPEKIIYKSDVKEDPFSVPVPDKVGLLIKSAEICLSKPDIKKVFGMLFFQNTKRILVTSDGFEGESDVTISAGGYQAIAVGKGDARWRSFYWPPLSKGYELIREAPFIESAPRIAEQAREHLYAPECPAGEKDLILDSNHLALTIHESVGHATELDRVLGMEESLAGKSFATTEKLNTYQYASPIVNFIADNTLPYGLATQGFDDDGVKSGKWYIIKDGILRGYSTNREVSRFIGEDYSRGCNRADNWSSIPIVRIPNLSLEPGKEPLSLDDLIADTKDGIFIEGMGSFSIDHMRINFQFGGDIAWEIKNGKITRMLKNCIYYSYTTYFWNQCDAICDKNHWKPFGVLTCGKGDPMQIAQMTHGASPARFRKIKVGGVKPW